MKINWTTGKRNWAFMYICEHYSRALGKFQHVFNGSGADIEYICSPDTFQTRKGSSKMILHVDSNRWYEREDAGQ